MRLMPLLLFLLTLPAQAGVRFLAPLSGSQVAGRTLIEVTSDEPVARIDFLIDGRLAGVARTAPYRYVHDFGTDLTAHTITAIAHAPDFQSAQRAEVRTLPLATSDALTVNVVELPLQIRARGVVRAGDIQVVENGRRQKVDELRNRRGPSNFVFIVDRSLSMNGGKFEAALAAVDSFRAGLNREDKATLITFNHRVDRPTALERGMKSAELVRSTTPSGGTSLRDALAEVDRRERTIVIVISDGADRNSALEKSETISRIASRDVTVYALLLGGGNAESLLRELAQRTGGNVSRTSTQTLRADALEILQELNSRYVAVYQSNNSESGWRTVSAKGVSRQVTVTSPRKGYFVE